MHRANVKAELCCNEGKCSDMSRENQRLRQEILQERFEREKSRQEFKRIGSGGPSSLAGSATCLAARPPSFNVSPATVQTQSNEGATSSGVPTPIPAGTGGSPRKRTTVASRFANNETQT